MLHTVDITKIYLHTFFLAEFTEISKEAGEVSENLDVTGHVENEKNDIGLESENVDQTNLQFDKNSQCCPSLEPRKDDSNQNETNEETSQGNSPQCLKFKIFSATQILREINFVSKMP